jgi:hypothetical protein
MMALPASYSRRSPPRAPAFCAASGPTRGEGAATGHLPTPAQCRSRRPAMALSSIREALTKLLILSGRTRMARPPRGVITPHGSEMHALRGRHPWRGRGVQGQQTPRLPLRAARAARLPPQPIQSVASRSGPRGALRRSRPDCGDTGAAGVRFLSRIINSRHFTRETRHVSQIELVPPVIDWCGTAAVLHARQFDPRPAGRGACTAGPVTGHTVE